MENTPYCPPRVYAGHAADGQAHWGTDRTAGDEDVRHRPFLFQRARFNCSGGSPAPTLIQVKSYFVFAMMTSRRSRDDGPSISARRFRSGSSLGRPMKASA